VRDGIELPAHAPLRRACSSRRILLNVGALYEVKGQAKILEYSLPWLRASRRHHLVFVGGTRTAPAYAEAMKARVAAERLERQVRLLGSREDVPRLLALADALVAYSSVEGIPRVVMEAMGAGLPVIVSATPGMDEVVADGEVGRIVDFDAGGGALARVLQDFSANPALWRGMGAKARARAEARHSTRAMSGALQDLYNELLHERETKP
jgi:glycosyltransferase involved in cell wall biosynthesis